MMMWRRRRWWRRSSLSSKQHLSFEKKMQVLPNTEDLFASVTTSMLPTASSTIPLEHLSEMENNRKAESNWHYDLWYKWYHDHGIHFDQHDATGSDAVLWWYCLVQHTSTPSHHFQHHLRHVLRLPTSGSMAMDNVSWPSCARCEKMREVKNIKSGFPLKNCPLSSIAAAWPGYARKPWQSWTGRRSQTWNSLKLGTSLNQPEGGNATKFVHPGSLRDMSIIASMGYQLLCGSKYDNSLLGAIVSLTIDIHL